MTEWLDVLLMAWDLTCLAFSSRTQQLYLLALCDDCSSLELDFVAKCMLRNGRRRVFGVPCPSMILFHDPIF